MISCGWKAGSVIKRLSTSISRFLGSFGISNIKTVRNKKEESRNQQIQTQDHNVIANGKQKEKDLREKWRQAVSVPRSDFLFSFIQCPGWLLPSGHKRLTP